MPIRDARLPGVAADAGPREGVPVPLLPTLVFATVLILLVLALRSLRDPGRAGRA
jgi:hypothetical protein